MILFENYLYDGADAQSRAVMAYLQSRVECITEETYTGNGWMPFEGRVYISRYSNYGRENGYVFSVRYHDHQANYAVFQHCVSDDICVVKSNVVTDTPNGWDGKPWTKYEHDAVFPYGKAFECSEWIEKDMKAEIHKWVANEKEDSYKKEKEELLDIIRDAVEENGGFVFKDGEKVFHPIYVGEPREERIREVYTEESEEGENPYVIVVTTFTDESGMPMDEHTNCADFSNDEIKEIIKLIGAE